MKSVAVIGAGAVGAFYGAKLQKHGRHVQYQSAGMYEAGVKTLNIKSIWGDFSVEADIHRSGTTMQKADLVILSSKYYPDTDYESLLKPVVDSHTVILVLQNGIGMEERLMKTFTGNPVAGALAFTCINRTSAGNIEHLDYGRIMAGPAEPEYNDRVSDIVHLFSSAGIEIEQRENLRYLRWLKLLWNVPFNTLSVLGGGVQTDRIINDSGMLELCRELMSEVILIAAAESIDIEPGQIDVMVERTRKMQAYSTSMMLDYINRRPLEIYAILGAPVALAEKLNVEVKSMKTCLRLLTFLNRENLRESLDTQL